jgi:hypothetical protein
MPHFERLSEEDVALISDLCERAGIAPVVQALAERCAFESTAPGAHGGWEDVFRMLIRVAQRVVDLGKPG